MITQQKSKNLLVQMSTEILEGQTKINADSGVGNIVVVNINQGPKQKKDTSELLNNVSEESVKKRFRDTERVDCHHPKTITKRAVFH